jgi:hypothetical protein
MANERVALTVKEAAHEARVSVKFFYALIGKRLGPPVKRIGDRIIIPARTFYLWLETPTKAKGKR